eukprot:scaffold55717_cov65-Phaeocystis_antarctica.AAC.2
MVKLTIYTRQSPLAVTRSPLRRLTWPQGPGRTASYASSSRASPGRSTGGAGQARRSDLPPYGEARGVRAAPRHGASEDACFCQRPGLQVGSCARWASGRKPRRWPTSTGWLTIEQRPAEHMKPPHTASLESVWRLRFQALRICCGSGD